MTTFFRSVGFRWVDTLWTDSTPVLPWRVSSRIVDRWVYVFAQSEACPEPWLYAELYVDAEGMMHALDSRRSRQFPHDRHAQLLPAADRAALVKSSDPVREIPLMSDLLGSRCTYWAWGSPSVLDSEGVSAVASAIAHGIVPKYPCHSPAALFSLYEDDDPLARLHVPVLDPLHIAQVLGRTMRTYLDEQLRMLTDRPLQARLLVARALKGLLTADSRERNRAGDEWGAGLCRLDHDGRTALDHWLAEQDSRYLDFGRSASAAASDLTAFLVSDVFRACEHSFLVAERPSQYERFVAEMTDAMAGLDQVDGGREGLPLIFESDLKLFKQLVAPTSPISDADKVVKALSAAKDYTGNAKKLADLFDLFLMPEILKSESRAQRIATALNALFVGPGEASYKVVVGAQGTRLERTELRQSPVNRLALGIRSVERSIRAVRQIHDKLLAVTSVDDLCAWLTDPEPDWSTRAKGMQALTSLASFAAKESSLARASKLLGRMGGVFGVGFSVADALHEREGDVKLAKGVEAALATASLVVGLIPGSPVWIGTVMALLMVGVHVFTESLKDTPLEQFARHCHWGRLHGQPSESQAELKDWMRGGFHLWKEPTGIVQLEALTHLMCAFTVSEASAPQVHEPGWNLGFPIRVDCTVLPPSSRFKITWSGSRSVKGGVWDSCSLLVQLTNAGLRVFSSDGGTDITADMRYFVTGVSDAGRPYFVVSYPKAYPAYTVASIAYVQLEVSWPRSLKIPDAPVRYIRLRDQRDKGDSSRSSVDAPHDTPVYTVWSDHPSANWMIEGQPIHIECKEPPAHAVCKVEWSIGSTWTYANTYLERTPSGWKLMDTTQSLRLFTATLRRIKISFPTAIPWQLGEPIKCSVQMLSPAKVYPKVEYWPVEQGTRAPARVASSERTA